MSQMVPYTIVELEAMRKYPTELFFRGDLGLLKYPKVSIVGTRTPSLYTQQITEEIAKALRKRGVCIVSGAVLGCGLDIRYPVVNSDLIASIERKGLLLSPFNDGFRATNWSFVVRNELVVALGEMLVVGEADLMP